MRIGILPVLDGAAGGVYQYSLTMLDALAEYGTNSPHSFAVVAEHLDDPVIRSLPAAWARVPLPAPPDRPALHRLVGRGVAYEVLRGARARFRTARHVVGRGSSARLRSRPDLHALLRRHGIGLMIYPAPHPMSFESGIPYIMAVHDLQHRLQRSFPEVSKGGEWEEREYIFRNGITRATLVLVDSDVGKEDVLSCYGADGVEPDRIKVLPFLPAPYLHPQDRQQDDNTVLAHYGLPAHYIFYPAQFWPHKNHMGLVEALGLAQREYGLRIQLVLCGSNTGRLRNKTFRAVMQRARSLGVSDQITNLGFVSNDRMNVLYSHAQALAMPTFFGPTNIPVLEAWRMDCPVLTSDLRGIREQVGDAALLVDPASPQSIAQGLARLWTDETLRLELIRNGQIRLSRYTPEDYFARLAAIVDEAIDRVPVERSVVQ